jgi:Leucine Rich repeat
MIGQALHSKNELNLLVLKLDHNPIGSEGLKHLAEGISMNKQLVSVSLTYCNIDE